MPLATREGGFFCIKKNTCTEASFSQRYPPAPVTEASFSQIHPTAPVTEASFCQRHPPAPEGVTTEEQLQSCLTGKTQLINVHPNAIVPVKKVMLNNYKLIRRRLTMLNLAAPHTHTLQIFQYPWLQFL